MPNPVLARLWWRLVRFGFRLLYNEFAFTYDWISWLVSFGEWRCWIRAALSHIDARSPVLELAHGTGNLQIDLNVAGYYAVGYDLSPGMGRIAQRKLHKHGVAARIARGRAQQLPFASDSFAAVVSTFPTDFIVAPETIREVYRVLQLGGVFVIVPNAAFLGTGRGEKALDRLYRITGPRGGSTTNQDALAIRFAPFVIEIVHERCPRSLVTVIVARKK